MVGVLRLRVGRTQVERLGSSLRFLRDVAEARDPGDVRSAEGVDRARLPFAEELLSAYYCAFDRETPVVVRTALIGAEADRASAFVRLTQALGGGWSPDAYPLPTRDGTEE